MFEIGHSWERKDGKMEGWKDGWMEERNEKLRISCRLIELKGWESEKMRGWEAGLISKQWTVNSEQWECERVK